jgi:hypothetical protein
MRCNLLKNKLLTTKVQANIFRGQHAGRACLVLPSLSVRANY